MSNFRYVRTSKTSNIFLTKVSFRPRVLGGGAILSTWYLELYGFYGVLKK